MNHVMLAASEIPSMSKLKWPKLGSPKLDGIRCYIGQNIYSRHKKPIPNRYVIERMRGLVGKVQLDGELMLPGDFNAVQSAIMSEHGTPMFEYHVFDTMHAPSLSAMVRTRVYTDLVQRLNEEGFDFIKAVPQVMLMNAEQAETYMQQCVAEGYEGVILKDPSAPYKFGRSTLKQEIMLKYKYFHDTEGVIVGFTELMHNLDTSTKRKDNMVPGNTLGAFIVEWNGVRFEVGGGKGLTAAMRKRYWNMQPLLLGKNLTFKYQELSANGVPRFPTYKAIRDARI